MTLVSFVSAKGAPGVTQTVLALAPLWGGQPLVADLDPAGGDIRYLRRHANGAPLDADRGLLGFGVALRGGKQAELDEHVQQTEDGLDVLAGVVGPGQVQGLGPVWTHIGAALAGAERDVLADCGRLTPGSPAWPVVERSDAVVFVVRSQIAAVAHVRDRIRWVQQAGEQAMLEQPSLGVLVVGDPADTASANDLERLLAASGRPVPVLGTLAVDPKGVRGPAVLGERGVRRSLLRRSAVDLVPRIRSLAGEPASPAPVPPAPAPAAGPSPAPTANAVTTAGSLPPPPPPPPGGGR